MSNATSGNGYGLEKPIAIYYEHPDWFRPLFQQLDERGVPWLKIDARQSRRTGFTSASIPRRSCRKRLQRAVESLRASRFLAESFSTPSRFTSPGKVTTCVQRTSARTREAKS